MLLKVKFLFMLLVFIACSKTGVLTIFDPDGVEGLVPGAPVLEINAGLSNVSEGAGTYRSLYGKELAPSDLSVSDDDQPASEVIFTLISAPTKGSIYFNSPSTLLGVSDTFTMQDINDGFIEYRHTAGEISDNSGTDTDSFIFTYSDGITTSDNQTFTISLVTLCTANTSLSNYNSVGDGTIAEPYFICHEDQIHNLGSQTGAALSSYYKLRSDIDMSSIAGNHNIIGSLANNFTGTFDGNNHSISNWTYSNAATDYAGVFGYVAGDGGSDGVGDGDIKNINIRDIDLAARNSVGGLIGYMATSAKVSNSSVKGGSISGGATGDNIGGLVGYASVTTNSVTTSWADIDVDGEYNIGGLIGRNHGDVSFCYALGDISGVQDMVGGLLGSSRESGILVSDNFAMGDISGDENVGGLIGYAQNITLSRSYATGTVVSASGDAGGLIGSAAGGVVGNSISDSYATGNVINTVAGDGAGGLVGTVTNHNITRSYATGDVTGRLYAGGLVGEMISPSNDIDFDQVYARGDVYGLFTTGGLVGRVNVTGTAVLKIIDSYARGDVYASSVSGGLVGQIETSGTGIPEIVNSYSSGLVSGVVNQGGLVSTDTAGTTYTSSFWDVTASGQAASTGGVGCTTGEMKKQGLFNLGGTTCGGGAAAVNWDFYGEATETWVMVQNGTDDRDYPQLTFSYKCYDTAWTSSPNYVGAGTRTDPIIICRAPQLEQLGNTSSDYDKHIKLNESLQLTAYDKTYWLGSDAVPFTGVFDGNARNGYYLDDLNSSQADAGFFQEINGDGVFDYSGDGLIYDTNFSSVLITCSNSCGALVSENDNGTGYFYNISLDGDVSTTSASVGVGSVMGSGAGVLHKISGGIDVTAVNGSYGGGLIGSFSSGVIKKSFNTGSVSAFGTAGGLVGQDLSGVAIENSYSSGSVTSTVGVAGGITGGSLAGTLTNVIATGAISGIVEGGISGLASGTCSDSFWDTTTTTIATSACAATGLTTVNAQTEVNFTNWNFDSLWTTDSNTAYPNFLWAK